MKDRLVEEQKNLKRMVVIFCFLSLSFSVFGSLGVTYNQIMNGVFEEYFDMKYTQLSDGTPRYIGTYGIMTIEVFGNKNHPTKATFNFALVDDQEMLSSVSVILYAWMENIMVHSHDTAFKWLSDVWKNNSKIKENEITEYFKDYAVKTSWVPGIMMIEITRHELTSGKSRLNHLIKINTEPKDGGYIQINESGPKETINEHVESGANTTLTAIPEEGNVFDGWFKGGVFVTDENPYTTEFTSLTILEARFRRAGTINIVSDEFKLDENIQIKINGNDLPTITSFVLYITYDMDILEPAKKSLFSLSETLTDYDFYNATVMDDGKIKISIGTTKTNPALIDGIIGIMEFRSKRTKGETNITITDDSKILGVDFREMELVFEHGIVFIDD